MRILAALGLMFVAACAPMTLADNVKVFRSDDHRMGTLDASLHALPEQATASRREGPRDPAIAFSAESGHLSLTWRGYDGRQMCAYTMAYWQLGGEDTYKNAKPKFEKHVNDVVIVWSAYDSLEAIPHDWPVPPASSNNRVVDSSVAKSGYRDADGDWQKTKTAEFELEFCGPAPVVTASTRVITAMGYSKESKEWQFYAWKIEGSPSVASAPVVEASTAEEPPAASALAATDSPAVASKRAVPGAMKDAKGYLGFLDIVDCAKKYNELSNGKLSVLAFSDATIMSVMPDKKARYALKERATCLAIYSAHVAAEVTNDAGVLKAVTLDGKTREVQLDRSLPIIEAKNGKVYPVRELWAP